jgi:hypothetical protein
MIGERCRVKWYVRSDGLAANTRTLLKGWVAKKWIRRYRHLRPDFIQDELGRVPDFALEIRSKIAVIDPFDPELQAVA